MLAAVVMATVAEPVARRISAATSQARKISGTWRVEGDVDDGLGDAAVLQDAAEASAGSDEQGDGGGGSEAFVAELSIGSRVKPAWCRA